MPISLVIPNLDSDVPKGTYEAWANGDNSEPLGRELDLAELLRFIKANDIKNVVGLTADGHYAAAHFYDPTKAQFTDFNPCWEFVAGPIHAGTFGPNELDHTLGPQVMFKSVPDGMKPNRPPSEGLQFFGLVTLDGKSEVMTVSPHNVQGEKLYGLHDLRPL